MIARLPGATERESLIAERLAPCAGSSGGAALEATATDFLTGGAPTASGEAMSAWDVILAGDVFYDAPFAAAASAFFEREALKGAVVLAADPGRR